MTRCDMTCGEGRRSTTATRTGAAADGTRLFCALWERRYNVILATTATTRNCNTIHALGVLLLALKPLLLVLPVISELLVL